MINNISVLFSNSKLANKIRNRDEINTIDRSSSIEDAKAKVQKIIDSGAMKKKKVRKRKKDD